MNKLALLLLINVMGVQGHAVQESSVLGKFGPMVKTKFRTARGEDCLKPVDNNFYKLCRFKSSYGVKGTMNIGYTKFGSRMGKRGSLVIAPGRTESSLKYIEVAHDFIEKGYSPVYAIDHRSQGFSDRTQVESHKVHTTNFNYYVRDFNLFVNTVVKEDSKVDLKNLFLISSSMGGAITALYLERYQEQPFKATAMFGAMHKIIYPKPFNEWITAIAGTALCFPLLKRLKVMGLKCKEFVPGEGGRFDWDNRIFKENNLTHSMARFKLRDILWRRFPQIQAGGVTVQWAGTAALNGKILRANAKKIDLPMKVYSAEFDSVVDRDGHVVLCRRAPDCEHMIVKGAKHEILMEKDSLRGPIMRDMWKFFESL